MKLIVLLMLGLSLSPAFSSEHESHAGDDYADTVATVLSQISYVLRLGDLPELSDRAKEVVREGFRYCTLRETDWKDKLLSVRLRQETCEVAFSREVLKVGLSPDKRWTQICEALGKELFLEEVPERCEKILELHKIINVGLG